MTDKKPGRQVLALEAIKDHPYYPGPGDLLTVPADYAARWIEHGWAQDPKTGEVGERQGGPVTLEVHGAEHAATDTLEG